MDNLPEDLPADLNLMEMRPKIIGARVQRVEDPRLLTGTGQYTADIKLPNMAHLAFRRSEMAHATIDNIDVSAALAVPGVIAVYTAEDFYGQITPPRAESKTEGFHSTPILPLADGKVRHVGEVVVAVVAESRYIAEDAAEHIEIDFTPLPVIADPREAVKNEVLLHDDAGTNVLVDRTFGRGEVDDAFSQAAHIVGGDFRTTRKTASPIEARAAVCEWDRGRRTLTLWSATQVPGVIRDTIGDVFGLSGSHVRVIAPDVGGGFGCKTCLYPEEMVACAAAIKLGQPVKWVSDRMEDLVGTNQAFDEYVHAELAVDAEGHILGLRADVVGDSGAYSIYPWTAALEPVQVISFLPGPYRMPAYAARTRAVATPKTPLGAYRGIGRPTATFVMERLVDLAARAAGIDPVEMRRRNLVQPHEFPYRTGSGLVWDRVGFIESLDAVTDSIGYDDLRAEQLKMREAGRKVGLGVVCYAELGGIGSRIAVAPGMPINTGVETANIRIDATGAITANFGTASNGQGLETTLAQVVAEELGCRVEDVEIRHGDTSLMAHGSGSYASRSAVLAGGAATVSAREVRANVLKVAAMIMEVAESDIDMVGSRIYVPGTDREMTLKQVAHTYYQEMGRLPKEVREEVPLESTRSFDPYLGTAACASHAALVEVDPVTWGVKILKYAAAEDCGRIINPDVADGQMRGGIAQGVGVALLEEIIHDEDGQILTASLVDYVLPSAVEVPIMDVMHVESENPDNGTGFRGLGEGGIIGAPAAIANAIADALDIDIREIPITPEKLFRQTGN